jgi:hypothetical protein
VEKQGMDFPVHSSQASAGVRQGRRRISRHGAAALVAMLVPAVLFPVGLVLLIDDPRFAWLTDITAYPWEFWAIAACGTIATLGGTADWLFHRSGETVVGRGEHRAHVAALVGGIPLFGMMGVASLSMRPVMFLVPIFVVVIFMVILIGYDEFVFHRRCRWLETLFHRMLTFGNGLAFLAWVHWCFVRGMGHG